MTIAHIRTRDLPAICARRRHRGRRGRPARSWSRGDWIKPGAVVIDVGINRVAGRTASTAGRRRRLRGGERGRRRDHAGARRRRADDHRLLMANTLEGRARAAPGGGTCDPGDDGPPVNGELRDDPRRLAWRPVLRAGCALGSRAAGHRLVAPDLPGIGGDDETLAKVLLDQWAAFAVETCRRAAGSGPALRPQPGPGSCSARRRSAIRRRWRASSISAPVLMPGGVSRVEFRKGQSAQSGLPGDREADAGRPRHGDRTGTMRRRSSPSFPRPIWSPTRLPGWPPSRTSPARPRSASRRNAMGSVPRHYIECLHDPDHPDRRPALDAVAPALRERDQPRGGPQPVPVGTGCAGGCFAQSPLSKARSLA